MSIDNICSAYIAEVNGELKRSLLKGLEFINWREYAKNDSLVFVKPNFTFPRYKEGVTTSPELLKCLLEMRARKNIAGTK